MSLWCVYNNHPIQKCGKGRQKLEGMSHAHVDEVNILVSVIISPGLCTQ